MRIGSGWDGWCLPDKVGLGGGLVPLRLRSCLV
jgi:hypothetical protein